MIGQKSLHFRLKLVFLSFLILFLLIGVRLYFLQIAHQSFYANLAASQYGVEVSIPPSRAEIYDRHSQPLALNKETASIFALPYMFKEKTEETMKSLAFLQQYYPESYQRILAAPDKKFLWVSRHANKSEIERVTKESLPGLHILPEAKRFFVEKSCAHLLGFTDVDNKGIAGIELLFNKQLAGTPSLYLLQKDARSGSYYFERQLKQAGKAGTAVSLTIDRTLQFLAHQELVNTINDFGAVSGAVVIMNPVNGEILTMASYPPFDPHNMANTPLEHTKNVATTEAYEFGSVIKAFSGLAALEEGVVTPDELIDCSGKVTRIGGLRLENWQSTGIVTFRDVIRKSSNVGTARVALRLGPKLHDNLRTCGFGKKTGIQFPGERDGFVNPPKKWSRFSPMVMSFGYEMNGTVLQLARAMSIVSNGGYEVQPTLLLDKDSGVKLEKRLFKPETIHAFRDIITDPETIFPWIRKKYDLKDYRIMGKTGTARKIVDGRYSDKKHVYTFAGIVEKGDYKRVIVTFINQPIRTHMWASEISAPLFMKIAEKMVIHDCQTSHA